MKKLIIIFLVFFPILSFSQINFESGYIIRNNNIKTECLIRNVAWKNNPTSIEYKTTENEQLSTISITDIKEFGVANAYKFKRFIVNMDRSSDNINELSNSKAPNFKTETLLLKLLIEGSTNLYSYEDSNLIRYFISSGDHNEATQLIYKEYINDKENKIAQNSQYKQQLMNELKSENLVRRDFENLNYKENDLVKLFQKFYGSDTTSFSNHTEKQNNGSINLKIIAGANFTSFSLENSMYKANNFDFDTKAVFTIGLELEYVLPFNQNKWSLFLNPNYQKYKNEEKKSTLKTSVDYSFVELPVGIRHSFFLNKDSKIFVDAGYSMNFNFNSTVLQNSNQLEVSKSANLFLGLGFSYTKFSIEARYNFQRNILNDYVYNEGNYKSIAILAGYKFL